MPYEYFTPLAGTLGGAAIGLSASTLLLFNGDILGASGILASVLSSPRKGLTDPANLWKLSLIGTFMVTSALLPSTLGVDIRLAQDESIPIPSGFAMTAAGFLVGIGTRLGNGCTSGHGICGLGRESPRSLAAVLTFMAAAIGTVFLTSPTSTTMAKYTKFLRTDKATPFDSRLGYIAISVIMTALIGFPLRYYTSKKQSSASTKPDNVVDGNSNSQLPTKELQKIPGAVLSGSLFGTGLAVSGMVLPSKLHGFLDVTALSDGSWDPTLACVMGAGVVVSWFSYQLVPGFSRLFESSKNETGKGCNTFNCPINASTFHVPNNRTVDWKLLCGQVLFGVGWGLGLLCPGPALYHVSVGNPMVVFRWMPSFLIGSQIGYWIKTLS